MKSSTSADEVIAYLQEHPEFFREHPQALTQLQLEHESGAASSLLEHQVGVLRDQVHRLRRQVQQYHEQAADNEERLTKVNDMFFALIGVTGVRGLVDTARSHLEKSFGVDNVGLAITDPDLEHDDVKLLNSSEVDDLDAILKEKKAVCGRIAENRIRPVLGDIEDVQSAAVIPMGDPAFAVLVLGSKDESKFYPGMGTLFLDMMGQMLGQCLLAVIRSTTKILDEY